VEQPDTYLGRFCGMLKWLLILPIRLYQVTLSPLLGPNKCRYQPTCSHYAIEAIQIWGPFKGGWLAAKRIGSCHPWGGHGHDPVPQKPDADKPEKQESLS